MVDSVYRTRSLGVAAEGIPDQYADGKAAKVWEAYIGCKQKRTGQYQTWIVDLLRRNGCRTVLDVACGNGVDSVMLLEQGFQVVSTDASDKMLKYALRERWSRRKECAFDNWIIEEGNWVTLVDDVGRIEGAPDGGFDAVICLGNSFAHMPDFEGSQVNQKRALTNFMTLVRPGGLLLIDHRNYDDILEYGTVATKNIYYNSKHIIEIKCSNLYVNGKPTMITMDYVMDSASIQNESGKAIDLEKEHHFRLSYYPHRLDEFTDLLKGVFSVDSKHAVFGDFRPLGEIPHPAYYIHQMEKPPQ